MEKLANKIAETIAIHLGHDEEKTAVVSYGLAALLQMIIIFIVISAVGILGGFWAENLVMFFGVGLFRRSTGGAHSQTFSGCLFISIFSICLMGFLARYLFPIANPLALSLFYDLVFVFSVVMTYKKAPIDTPNKPILRPEKIKRLRRSAFITLSLYFIIAMALVYLSGEYPRLHCLATSIAFAVLWQTFMLTNPGMKLIAIIDRKFQYE